MLFSFYTWLGLVSEKAMAPHPSTLAWKIQWTEELGGLQSMGSLRVRHNWATSLSLFTFMHWRRKWQLTPVFFPGESQGWGSPVGCHLWGRTESDKTEVISSMLKTMTEYFKFDLTNPIRNLPSTSSSYLHGQSLNNYLSACYVSDTMNSVLRRTSKGSTSVMLRN